MTINQTQITDELEEFLISIGPSSIDQIGFVFSSAFAFDEPFQQISKLQAVTLKNFIKANSVKAVLEIGTFVGFSAFAMASALQVRGSRLTTLEVRKDYYDQAKANQLKYCEDVARGDKNDGIIEKIEFVLGDAFECIQQRSEEFSKFDLVFLDGDKENYSNYVGWFIEFAKPGAHLIIDNILFKGSILGDGKYAKGIKSAISMIKQSECLASYVVPVGDCMLIAKKV